MIYNHRGIQSIKYITSYTNFNSKHNNDFNSVKYYSNNKNICECFSIKYNTANKRQSI